MSRRNRLKPPEHDINDIDTLASTSVDDLVEILDLSLDEAEVILAAAKAVIAMRDKSLQPDEEGGDAEQLDSSAVTGEAADDSPDSETGTLDSGASTVGGLDESATDAELVTGDQVTAGDQSDEAPSANESAAEISTAEAQPTLAPESVEQAAEGGSGEDDEKQNASPDAAN